MGRQLPFKRPAGTSRKDGIESWCSIGWIQLLQPDHLPSSTTRVPEFLYNHWDLPKTRSLQATSSRTMMESSTDTTIVSAVQRPLTHFFKLTMFQSSRPWTSENVQDIAAPIQSACLSWWTTNGVTYVEFMRPSWQYRKSQQQVILSITLRDRHHQPLLMSSTFRETKTTLKVSD